MVPDSAAPDSARRARHHDHRAGAGPAAPEDSTFYGDLFPHAVKWKGVLYLEDGLHRAVRAALRNRVVLHARLFDMDAVSGRA